MNSQKLFQNYEQVIHKIHQLAENCSRNMEEITPICVSKTVDANTIRILYEAGQRHFAENRPKPFQEKYAKLHESCPDIIWHYIGHLQRRPVKDIINHIEYLHSLDRLSLAKEVQKRRQHPLNCFLQVNVSGETSKSGFKPEDLTQVIEEIKPLDKINIIGLMTMAPKEASSSDILHYFKTLQTLQEKISKKNIPNMPCHELSMGMSQDYPLAIEAGSTYLRIGSAFFKNR